MNALSQRLPAVALNAALSQSYLDKRASDDWYTGKSDVDGQGVFAGQPFREGDVIGTAMTSGGEDEFGSKIWNLTELARYCNHQTKNNVRVDRRSDSLDRFELVADRDLDQDEELFADYAQVSRALGPRTDMQWQGKSVPAKAISEYQEKDAV